jgi:hypothetical protein
MGRDRQLLLPAFLRQVVLLTDFEQLLQGGLHFLLSLALRGDLFIFCHQLAYNCTSLLRLVVIRPYRDIDPLSPIYELKPLTVFQGVGQPPQLSHKFLGGVGLFNITILFHLGFPSILYMLLIFSNPTGLKKLLGQMGAPVLDMGSNAE